MLVLCLLTFLFYLCLNCTLEQEKLESDSLYVFTYLANKADLDFHSDILDQDLCIYPRGAP